VREHHAVMLERAGENDVGANVEVAQERISCGEWPSSARFRSSRSIAPSGAFIAGSDISRER